VPESIVNKKTSPATEYAITRKTRVKPIIRKKKVVEFSFSQFKVKHILTAI
jgi:hypothetical protein